MEDISAVEGIGAVEDIRTLGLWWMLGPWWRWGRGKHWDVVDIVVMVDITTERVAESRRVFITLIIHVKFWL